MREIARGAEAVLYRDGDEVVKERVSKGYRLEELDERLREERTSTEERLIRAAKRAGVRAPQVRRDSEDTLRMQWIEGGRVRDVLDDMPVDERASLAESIGRSIGRLHRNGIVHGDLTTSNMLTGEDGSVHFIDFGLGSFTKSVEDRAMDLYLLHQAVVSTHHGCSGEVWESVLEGYRSEHGDAGKVLNRLEKIVSRGRYVER